MTPATFSRASTSRTRAHAVCERLSGDVLPNCAQMGGVPPPPFSWLAPETRNMWRHGQNTPHAWRGGMDKEASMTRHGTRSLGTLHRSSAVVPSQQWQDLPLCTDAHRTPKEGRRSEDLETFLTTTIYTKQYHPTSPPQLPLPLPLQPNPTVDWLAGKTCDGITDALAANKADVEPHGFSYAERRISFLDIASHQRRRPNERCRYRGDRFGMRKALRISTMVIADEGDTDATNGSADNVQVRSSPTH